VLLRILLIGYLYGITSERKLVEELRMHLAWRWFTGLGFDQEIPHHSTFSKNRHGRFQESKLFQQLFEEIVQQCTKAGLVQGEHLSVDGSFIQANASNASRVPREQLVEAAQVKGTVREYLTELEQENGTGEPTHQQDRVSTTDPDATYASKGTMIATLGYYDNYLVDNHSCVIVDVQATAARLSQESVAAREMITRFTERQGRPPQTLAADTSYDAFCSPLIWPLMFGNAVSMTNSRVACPIARHTRVPSNRQLTRATAKNVITVHLRRDCRRD
jgi:hypothetical protein